MILYNVDKWINDGVDTNHVHCKTVELTCKIEIYINCNIVFITMMEKVACKVKGDFSFSFFFANFISLINSVNITVVSYESKSGPVLLRSE